MTTGATYNDINNLIGDAAGAAAEFTSSVFEGIQTGAITAADAQGRLADAFAQDFQRYSDSASRFAVDAALAGKARAAEVFNRISNEFSKAAADRLTSSAAAYNQKIASQALDGFAGAAKNVGPAADVIQAGAGVAELISTGDFNTLGGALAGIGGSIAGAFIGGFLAAAIGGPAIVGGIIIGIAAAGLGFLAEAAWKEYGGGINDFINDFFAAARNWFQPRYDPLTLDLDGDGLETIGINPAAPILFDHNGDGIKSATGWVKPDDGFLVLDRNGNGVIDNGRELFGDSTPLTGGGNAADGFAALAAEDTNLDGKVSAADARFADLRVWRDLNQDGISQSSELATLAALNIVSINVAKTANNQVLANGNQIADLGTYTKTDGTIGGLGETAQLGDVNLADNPFYSKVTDTIPITAEAPVLPAMQDRGRVQKEKLKLAA